ncbi:hypothetical protein YC2023_015401 [Brassica napus]
MNSNSKSPVSGDFTAKKSNGKDVVSSGEPVKQAVQTSVSLSSTLSGDLKTKKPNGKAVVSSAAPIRRTDHTSFFCVNADSGDLMLKKANGKAVDSSGALNLSSLSSFRMFFEMDFQPTRDYLAWLNSNSEVANMVNPEIVTKAETATIGDIFSYMKQEGTKVQPLNVSHIHALALVMYVILQLQERKEVADELVKRSSDGVESGEVKRAKCG